MECRVISSLLRPSATRDFEPVTLCGGAPIVLGAVDQVYRRAAVETRNFAL